MDQGEIPGPHMYWSWLYQAWNTQANYIVTNVLLNLEIAHSSRLGCCLQNNKEVVRKGWMPTPTWPPMIFIHLLYLWKNRLFWCSLVSKGDVIIYLVLICCWRVFNFNILFKFVEKRLKTYNDHCTISVSWNLDLGLLGTLERERERERERLCPMQNWFCLTFHGDQAHVPRLH
jgi:hypothetical protein